MYFGVQGEVYNDDLILPPSDEEVDRNTRRTRKVTRSRSFDNMQHQRHGIVVHDTETFASSLILSQLDEEEYERAVLVDSENIMQRHLLPKSLPWCNTRVPLLRNLPRDIEDMKCMWYASDGGDGDLFRSDVNEGPHGFGMFDMNGLRIDIKGGVHSSQAPSDTTAVPTRGQDIINSSPGPSPGKRRVSPSETEKRNDEMSPFSRIDLPYTASARRSTDPGIIELTGMFIWSSLLFCASTVT